MKRTTEQNQHKLPKEWKGRKEKINDFELDETDYLTEDDLKLDETDELIEDDLKLDETDDLTEDDLEIDETDELTEDDLEIDETDELTEDDLELDETDELAEDDLELDETDELAEDDLELDETDRLAEDDLELDETDDLTEDDLELVETDEPRRAVRQRSGGLLVSKNQADELDRSLEDLLNRQSKAISTGKGYAAPLKIVIADTSVRLELSKEITKALNNPSSLYIGTDQKGLVITNAENLAVQAVNCSTRSGKATVYNSGLIKNIASQFSLDFSTCTSLSFQKYRFKNYGRIICYIDLV